MTHNITIVLDLHFSSVCDKLNIDIVSVYYNCDVRRARRAIARHAIGPLGPPARRYYLDLKYSVNFTM